MSRIDCSTSDTEKRHRLLIHERRAASRELDHVAGEGAQTERRAVDQSELSLLDRPSARRPPPARSRSARMRIEPSGERMSCAISTTSCCASCPVSRAANRCAASLIERMLHPLDRLR